mgnify:CR=1 FL=1
MRACLLIVCLFGLCIPGLAYAADMDTLALGFFETAKELRPQSVEARYNLAYCLQEHKPTNRRFLDRAHKEYREILEIDPSNAASAFNQGYIFLEYLQAYDSAAHHFSKAIEALPYYHQAFFNRGLAYESLGEADQAELDYREALRFKPDYTAAAMALERVLNR